MAGSDVEAGASIRTENGGISNARSGAGVMMVNSPAADDSKYRKLS